MLLKVHTTIPEDASLAGQWNRLVTQTECPEIFYTYEWALAMARAHPAAAPLLVTAYEKEVLVGVAALVFDQAKTSLSFLSSTTADYCDFLSPPEVRALFVKLVLHHLKSLGIKKLTLANLPVNSATVTAISSVQAENGYRMLARPAYLCARVMLHTPQQRQDVIELFEKKKMLRRQLKNLGRLSLVRLRHLRSGDDIRSALPHFFKTHVARFFATGRISNITKSERRNFLLQLVDLLSEHGQMLLTQLMVGERAVAWNYGFEYYGGRFWYQPTFESELERYSPGLCLLTMMVEEACDNSSVKLLDLGLGAEGYKDRFANATRQTMHVTLTSSRLRHAESVLKYRTVEWIKRSPRLERKVRSGVASLIRLKKRIHRHGVVKSLAWCFKRVRESLFHLDEVVFFHAAGLFGEGSPSAMVLRPVDLGILADAAMQHENDDETLSYLLRGAGRLQTEGHRGFALLRDDGQPVHFCWVAPFEGFHLAELDIKLRSPSANAVLIFDCWTPVAFRGLGYYGCAVGQLSHQLIKEGQKPWIFSAAENKSSLVSLDKSAFRRGHSLVRRTILGWRTVQKNQQPTASIPAMQASASSQST
ncbi:MAG: GNAT family N-acetyltransferase [Acidobacteriaceae bacterium]